ncbi:MAG TPA: bacteriocin family protein [Candidatus Avacidaminococcus intestinavium]|uniref:Type 1 encapsulin shell protein n=1 Tax=Candidatus Avacidaminococcus intestinavium TaxID=2840684 RepID=A0A9D1SL78_9FIRM|nr:bacteriocin family protein [Candidatus Avacidaminococcus intestinavium]
MEYLDRDSAPLTESEWNKIDAAVVASARTSLIGRRILNLEGPLGAGTYSLPYSVYSAKPEVAIDMNGEGENNIIEAASRKLASLPLIYADFKLSWRDIETDRKSGLALDVSASAIAAGAVAAQEDDLIFNGNKALGLEGLMNVSGRNTIKLTKWEDVGAGLADVVRAVNTLATAAHFGPYALVTSPSLYGKLVRVYASTGLLELEQIKTIVTGGVYYSNALQGDKAILLETGAQNSSLAIGQDFTTGYLGAEKMNHLFRVLETITLLVRRPQAICTLE